MATPVSPPRKQLWIFRHPFWSATLIFIVALAASMIYAASLDDFDVHWVRAVPSKESPNTLGNALSDLTVWPVFHHNLKQANTQDAKGEDLPPEESELLEGARLRYEIEPPRKEWKRFEIFGRISEYVPHRRLVVEFEADSTGKISRLFDHFSWSVEVIPAPEDSQAKGFQSVTRGEARARTINWRGRFFGTFAPRILMNQVYYLDLVKFGTLERQIEARKNNFAPDYQ